MVLGKGKKWKGKVERAREKVRTRVRSLPLEKLCRFSIERYLPHQHQRCWPPNLNIQLTSPTLLPPEQRVFAMQCTKGDCGVALRRSFISVMIRRSGISILETWVSQNNRMSPEGKRPRQKGKQTGLSNEPRPKQSAGQKKQQRHTRQSNDGETTRTKSKPS